MQGHWLRLLVFGLLGLLPGIAVTVFRDPRAGIPVIFLGTLIGVLLGLPGVSPSRVFRFLTAYLAVRNLPVTPRGMDAAWVDGDSDIEENEDLDDRLLDWLLPRVTARRGWLVAAAMVTGALMGLSIGFRDAAALEQGRPGWVLPISDDNHLSQIAVLTIGLTVWFGCAFAIFASAAYRRPVLLGVLFPGFLASSVAFAVWNGHSAFTKMIVVAFVTLGGGIALWFGFTMQDLHDEVDRKTRADK